MRSCQIAPGVVQRILTYGGIDPFADANVMELSKRAAELRRTRKEVTDQQKRVVFVPEYREEGRILGFDPAQAFVYILTDQWPRHLRIPLKWLVLKDNDLPDHLPRTGISDWTQYQMKTRRVPNDPKILRHRGQTLRVGQKVDFLPRWTISGFLSDGADLSKAQVKVRVAERIIMTVGTEWLLPNGVKGAYEPPQILQPQPRRSNQRAR